MTSGCIYFTLCKVVHFFSSYFPPNRLERFFHVCVTRFFNPNPSHEVDAFYPPTNNSKVKETPSPTPLQRQGARVINPTALFSAMGRRDNIPISIADMGINATIHKIETRNRTTKNAWRLISTLLDPSQHPNLELSFTKGKNRTGLSNDWTHILITIIGYDPTELSNEIDSGYFERWLGNNCPELKKKTWGDMWHLDQEYKSGLYLKRGNQYWGARIFENQRGTDLLNILGAAQRFAETELTPLPKLLSEAKPPNSDQLSLFSA